MPTALNPNKFRIISNSNDLQDSYGSNEGSGIDLNSPVSMEVSYRTVNENYIPIQNDYFILCDCDSAGSSLDIDLQYSNNTFKHGKVLVIKILNADGGYVVTLRNTTTDTVSDYQFDQHLDSVMIVYNKIDNNWWIMAAIGKVG